MGNIGVIFTIVKWAFKAFKWWSERKPTRGDKYVGLVDNIASGVTQSMRFERTYKSFPDGEIISTEYKDGFEN